MFNISEENKDYVVKSVLKTIDDVNVVNKTNNYTRKYGEVDVEIELMDDESLKRFYINSREQLRKILLTDWYQQKFTTTQIQDINSTLTLVRQIITNLFTN
jgi:hypothetical protein